MINPVECRTEAGQVRVVVPGPDLDLVVAGELSSRLEALDAGDPACVVVVDLSAVSFMDCAGLSPLIRARNRLGPRLLLLGASAQPMRILHLTGLDGLFHQQPRQPEPTHLTSPPARCACCGDVDCTHEEAADHCSRCSRRCRIRFAFDATGTGKDRIHQGAQKQAAARDQELDQHCRNPLLEGLDELTIQVRQQFPYVRDVTVDRLVHSAADTHGSEEPPSWVLLDVRREVVDRLLHADPEATHSCPRCADAKAEPGVQDDERRRGGNDP